MPIGWFEIRAFYEPYVRFGSGHVVQVARTAIEIRLEHEPDAIELGAQPAVRLQRRIDVLRLFHIEANSVAGARSRAGHLAS